MNKTIIRNAEEKDYDRILELNEESVHFLSPMDGAKLAKLAHESDLFLVAEVDGRVEAFVLALLENKAYDSVNYLWFSERYHHFLYIDRVVVSVDSHGKRLGSVLYETIFEQARKLTATCIAAEIDIVPPNPVSLKFHEKFGFKEVGKQSVYDGQKVVSLQIADLK